MLRTSRGRYTPDGGGGANGSSPVDGVVGLRSAAASWGWATQDATTETEIIVPRGRKVTKRHQRELDVRWRRLPDGDVDGWRTSPLQTVIDCAHSSAG